MRIIDAHTHVLDRHHWPTEWWRWVAEDWASKESGRTPEAIESRIEEGLIDPDGARLVSVMDDAGVEASVVLPIDWGPEFSGTRPIEEVVAHTLGLAARHPGRIIPFGGIDPRRRGAPTLVREWIDAGIAGLKMYPSCGWDPRSVEAHAVYEVCGEASIPVLFHTGDPLPVLGRELSNPRLLRQAAAAWPQMPIWLGHAGAPHWWDEALALAVDFPNVRLELSVWIWDDSTSEQVDVFVCQVAEAVRAIGADRLLFGSDNVSGSRVRKAGFLDSVLGMYRSLPERLANHDIDLVTEQLGAILGGNALRDLRWESRDGRHG